MQGTFLVCARGNVTLLFGGDLAAARSLTAAPLDRRRPGPAIPKGAPASPYVARGDMAAVLLLAGTAVASACGCERSRPAAAATATCAACASGLDAFLAERRTAPSVRAGLALVRAGWTVLEGTAYGAHWSVYGGDPRSEHADALVLAVNGAADGGRRGGMPCLRELRCLQRSAQTHRRRLMLAVCGAEDADVQFCAVSTAASEIGEG